MLRQAQHERKIFNILRTKPVRPEPVEGRGRIFSPQIKKETYITSGVASIDRAFEHVSSRSDPVESFHYAVNAKVKEIFFALCRDFLDPGRVRGQEKF